MDQKTRAFLSKYPDLRVTDSGRVRCGLSGHEMPSSFEALQSYVKGKKFSSLKMHSDFNYAHLEPYILPSQRRKYQLFCALTNRYINRKPDEVRSHISGRKYIKALEQYKSGDRNLLKEPSKGQRLIKEGSQVKGSKKILDQGIESDHELEEEEEEDDLLSSVVSIDQTDSRVAIPRSTDNRTDTDTGMKQRACTGSCDQADIHSSIRTIVDDTAERKRVKRECDETDGSCDMATEFASKPILGERRMKKLRRYVAIAKKRKERQKESRGMAEQLS